MKKIILASALTVGLLIMPTQAVYAAGTTEVSETTTKVTNTDISQLKYEDIQKVIMEKSFKVKMNADTIDSAENGYLSLQDAAESLSGSVTGLHIKIKKLKDSESLPDANIPAIEATINALRASADSLENSQTSLENQAEDAAKGIERAKLSIEMANKGLVLQTESLFFANDVLLQQRLAMESNLAYLNKSYEVQKLRLTLGMVSGLDLKLMEQQIKDLEYQIGLLPQKLNSVRGQVNILIAQEFNHPLNLISQVIVDEDKIKAMDYNKDSVVALDKSYTLKLQQMEIEAKQLALDRAQGTDGVDSYVVKGALADLDAETLKLEEAKRKTAQDFDTASNTVHNNMEAYQIEKSRSDNAKTKLNYAKLSNQLGLISNLDMLGVTVEFTNQAVKVQNAKEELIKAITAYQWFLDGMSIS